MAVNLGTVDPYYNFRRWWNAPAEAMKTYRILSPKDTQLIAPCEKVGCGKWRHGWDTLLDETVPAMAEAANWIRHQSGRTFREGRTQSGWTVFRFEPYQRCFDDHKTRPQIFAVTGGDILANPLQLPPRRHANPDDWVEDFALHQQAVADRHNKG